MEAWLDEISYPSKGNHIDENCGSFNTEMFQWSNKQKKNQIYEP